MKTNTLRSILPSEFRRYDEGLVVGLGISGLLLVAAIVLSGNSLQFFDVVSFLIVIGGTLGATLVNFSSTDLQIALEAVRSGLREREVTAADRTRQLVALSHATRKDGLLSIEDQIKTIPDPFVRLALELAIDNQDTADIRRILETEIQNSEDHLGRAIRVFSAMGAYAPAMGLIGTLIGLIQMLSKLGDPSAVGPAMAVALITTLYGAVLANMVFLPIAGKLRVRADEASLVKRITVEGVLSLQRRENPMALEQRLQSFRTQVG